MPSKQASDKKRIGAGWTAKELELWRKRLDLSALTERDAYWAWTLPCGPAQTSRYQNCISQVLDRATNGAGNANGRQTARNLQRAIERLYHPNACLPAFYWGIMQALDFEHQSSQRAEDAKQRETLSDELSAITKGVADTLRKFNRLIVGTDNRRHLFIGQFPGDQFEAEQLFEVRLDHFREISGTMRDMLDKLERQAYFYSWLPAIGKTEAKAVDRYSVQFLFYIASEMFGNRRWGSVFRLMDEIAPILGYRNPFALGTVMGAWKNLSSSPNNYEQHFKNSIVRRQIDFVNEMEPGALIEGGEL